MAIISLDEAMNCIEELPYRVALTAVRIMREECPVGPTGALRKSIHRTKIARNVHTVGTDLPYAQYVINGRGPVHVHNAKALHWTEYHGRQTSTHTMLGRSGEDMFAVSVGPTEPNDFVSRTAARLEGISFDIRGNEH